MQALSNNYDIPRTRQMLDRALEVDAHFAEARAWKAFTTWMILAGGQSNDSALLNQAEAEVRRALQDDPTLLRAHTSLAALYLIQGRRERMPEELNQALKADPTDKDALLMLMLYHLYGGEYAKAQSIGQQVLERIPVFWPARLYGADLLRQQGDLTGAIREYGKILEQEPQHAVTLTLLARAHLDSGDRNGARQSMERIAPKDQQSYWVQLCWAVLLATEGQRDRALKEMDEQVLTYGALIAYGTAEVAVGYAVIGDAPKALEWLDRAVRNGDERMEYFRRDPLLAGIRDQPRFEQIMQSIAYRRQQRPPVR